MRALVDERLGFAHQIDHLPCALSMQAKLTHL
jgi:hypothetical protein